jgi:hypothetical protein
VCGCERVRARGQTTFDAYALHVRRTAACAWVGIINDAGPDRRLRQTRIMPQHMWPRSRHNKPRSWLMLRAQEVAGDECPAWPGCIYFLNANFGLSAESDQRTASYSYSTRTHVWAAHTSGSVVRREDKCDGGLPRGFLAREGARRAGTEAVVRMCASHPPTMHSNVEAAKFLIIAAHARSSTVIALCMLAA